MNEDPSRWSPSRRTLLLAGGAALVAACSDADDDEADPAPTDASAPSSASSTTSDASPTTAVDQSDSPATTATDPDGVPAALTPAMFEALGVCTLSAPSAEGPFPNLERLERVDISEGYPGHPLRLGIRVVDGACLPIADAVVAVWHADASGDYSSYEDGGSGKDEGDGTTFCRGSQTTNADGIVEFHTIYPGWYGGRAVHIHLQVVVDGSELLTTQLYFDEAYTDAVLETGEYRQFGPPDTRWADDGLIGTPASDGTGLTLSPAPTIAGDGTLGLINVGAPA